MMRGFNKLQVKINNQLFTVSNANCLEDNKGNALTCPTHIYNFVRYQIAYNTVICDFCHKQVYKVKGLEI